MRFPNAFKGVSKIFTAEILQLIGAFALLISGVVLVLTYQASTAASIDGALATLGTAMIVMLASGIITIIGLIINIVGLVQAKKDDKGFQYSLIFAVLAIVVTIVSVCLQTINPWLSNWLGFVGTIFELCVFEYVVVGIMSLARQIGDEKMLSFGAKIRTMITILYMVVLIAHLFRNNPDVGGIMAIVGSVFELIMYIVYLVYLARTKKMLANN